MAALLIQLAIHEKIMQALDNDSKNNVVVIDFEERLFFYCVNSRRRNPRIREQAKPRQKIKVLMLN